MAGNGIALRAVMVAICAALSAVNPSLLDRYVEE